MVLKCKKKRNAFLVDQLSGQDPSIGSAEYEPQQDALSGGALCFLTPNACGMKQGRAVL